MMVSLAWLVLVAAAVLPAQGMPTIPSGNLPRSRAGHTGTDPAPPSLPQGELRLTVRSAGEDADDDYQGFQLVHIKHYPDPAADPAADALPPCFALSNEAPTSGSPPCLESAPDIDPSDPPTMQLWCPDDDFLDNWLYMIKQTLASIFSEWECCNDQSDDMGWDLVDVEMANLPPPKPLRSSI